MKIKLLSSFLLLTIVAVAQKKNLTDNQMLRGDKIPNLLQPLPQVLGWLDDEQVLFSKKENGDTSTRYFIMNGKTGKVVPSSKDALQEEKSENINVRLINNDVFLYINGKQEKQLTKSSDPEVNPTLSPDKKWVAFTRKNDLYTVELSSGKEFRLTKDGSDLILNGYASWVYFEEILGRPSRYKSYWWSPDSKSICFMRMDDTRVPLFPIVGETGQHGYVENTRYPKSGDPNPTVKIGITSTDGSSLVWADFDENYDQYFGMPYWMPNASTLLLQWMNRGQDSLIIYAVNPSNGSKKEFYKEVQNTWVDLDDMGARISFLPSNKGIIIKSDKDGWDQLYLHNADGSLKNKITNGNHWSTDLQWIDTVKNVIYFTSREHESTRTDLYRVDFDGKNQMRLTFGDFTHSIDLSPQGSYFITRYSNASTPERLAMVNNKGKMVGEIGSSSGTAFEEYALAKTEIIRIPSEDGKFQLPIRITWPLNVDPSKKYPVMINIYGGPNAGTVRDGWQFSPLNQWWAKEGLIQVAMDHRASGHFGKNGVNYMHRNLGNWELKDWITIVKWLRNNGADSTRVGIAGFSYGGYMTSLALTKGAGYFTHGLAGGSVTDWHLYDSHYTERFMDTPKENAQGYAAGSIMAYVDNYKGLLRIYHGTMDDNVHMQNSLQLVKKLQDAKKHFEFMVYPGGRHGWGGNQSAHSTNENNIFIYKHLLNKEMPSALYR
ncbi:MAG: DPP IV N-terminal domain-containing protein [Chitinophagaceae bacterium]|jgi:dipeptidyl-peptidase-4